MLLKVSSSPGSCKTTLKKLTELLKKKKKRQTFMGDYMGRGLTRVGGTREDEED